MKSLIAALMTMISLASFATYAATKTTIILSSEEDRMSFEGYPYSRVLYEASNIFCKEMSNSHGIPFPTSKEQYGPVEIQDYEVSFERKLSGLCRYKFANTSMKLSLDHKYAANLRFFFHRDADKEVDLFCSVVGRRLKCRERGEGHPSSDISLYVNLAKETKINIHME